MSGSTCKAMSCQRVLTVNGSFFEKNVKLGCRLKSADKVKLLWWAIVIICLFFVFVCFYHLPPKLPEWAFRVTFEEKKVNWECYLRHCIFIFYSVGPPNSFFFNPFFKYSDWLIFLYIQNTMQVLNFLRT